MSILQAADPRKPSDSKICALNIRYANEKEFSLNETPHGGM